MDTYKEFCLRFWESTRNLDLYSMDGTQLDRLIVDALSKTNGGGELIKTSMNELSVLISAFNHNNGKIQSPSLPLDLDEAAKDYYFSPACSWEDNEERFINAFIAGAQWQRGQGQTKEGEVIEDGEFIKFSDGTYIDLCPGLGENSFNFKTGDKVIVQIKKV